MIAQLSAFYKQITVKSPIKINFIILIAIVCIAYKIYSAIKLEDNQYLPLIVAMCKIALLLIACLVLFCLATVMLSYWYCKQQIKANPQQLSILFNSNATKKSNMQVQIILQKIIMPIMGFIKSIFYYDNKYYTPILNVSSSAAQSGFIIQNLQSTIPMQLPDVKQYHIQYGYLLFEDFLRLFSIPLKFSTEKTFKNNPTVLEITDYETLPSQTNELTMRIPELRRIDGDILHFKKFSTSDDTRRIVWKIFAKNKELVVRTPEIFNPFASNIVMCTSFTNAYNNLISQDFSTKMLNYYKDAAYTIYDVIAKKDYAISYTSDQANIESANVTDRIIYSNWQNEIPIQEVVHPKKTNILCIQSLNSIADLQQLLQELQPNTIIYFIKTSKIFKENIVWKFTKRIFILPPADELLTIKNKWLFSADRLLIIKNEKEIEKLLQQTHPNFITN